MIGSRQKKARYHLDFYRDNYHKMLNVLLFLSFVMLVLIGAIIYFILFNPQPQYYASTTQGLIIPMHPSSQ